MGTSSHAWVEIEECKCQKFEAHSDTVDQDNV